MMYYRKIALAAALASGLALPAFAQTPAPAVTPTRQVDTPTPPSDPAVPHTDAGTPIPDAGVKKATPSATKHTHHKAHKPTAPVAAPKA